MREVVAADTKISDIDGEAGRLWYVGYEIGDLAAHATFEEVVYLLHDLDLPTRSQLTELGAFLSRARELHPFLARMMPTLAQNTSPMSMLRTSISAASAFDPDGWDESPEAEHRKAMRLIAKTPTLIATYDRLRTGKKPVPPNPGLSHAANFLWMLHGEEPAPEDAAALDTTFILYADHTMNASTFTARVIASTLSDMFSAMTGAIGALKGPLHGGANEESQKMAEEVGKPENAEAYVRERLAAHEKIMGFGHAVYTTRDPRATILKGMLKDLGERLGAAAVVRDLLRARGDHVRAEGPVSERRPLRGRRLPPPRDPDGPDDAGVRAGADGRVDRARPRAVRRQPDHPAGFRVRRPARSDLRADRPARLSTDPRPAAGTAPIARSARA